MCKTRPTLETLESRQLFAADPLSVDMDQAPTAEPASTLESSTLALLVEDESYAADDHATAETIETIADAQTIDYVFAAGDADQDGDFEQNDVVHLLQESKYLTDEPATWSQGDFTGDGRFDQQDIVAALQTGNYAHQHYNWWAGVGGLNGLLVWRGGW